MILLIDNFDSFVHNLARYFQQLGQPTRVVRNNAIDVDTTRRLAPRAIVLSPGPCTPREAGCSLEIVRQLHREFPLLGVCLGHQTIAAAFGAKVIRAPIPMHGRTSQVVHNGEDLFAEIPNPFVACRYHSLMVQGDSIPSEIEVTARTAEGVVMGIRHRDLPVIGVQFHPESILTSHGLDLLANFLRLAGVELPREARPLATELVSPSIIAPPLPPTPITF